MKSPHRSQWILALLLLLGIGYAWWITSQKPNPQKQQIDSVLQGLYKGNNQSNRISHSESDAARLRAGGTQTLDHLVKTLEGNELLDTAQRLGQKQSLVALPLQDPEEKKAQAVQAFRLLGPDAEAALPQLLKLLQNKKTAEGAAKSIAALGPSSTLILSQALTNETWEIRQAIGMALYESKHYLKPGFDQIFKLSTDPHEHVRQFGIMLLESAYFEEPKKVWEILQSRAQNQTNWILGVVIYSMTGIAEKNPEHKEEVLKLVQRLQDHPDPVVSGNAKSLLARLNGPPSPSLSMLFAFPALVNLANFHLDRETKMQILRDLEKQGKYARYAAPIIREALKDQDKAVQQAVRKTLVFIDPEERTVRETLNPHPMLMTHFSKTVSDFLSSMEKDTTNSESWSSMARLLSLWGPYATNAIPELEKGLKSGDPVRKEAAEFALKYIKRGK